MFDNSLANQSQLQVLGSRVHLLMPSLSNVAPKEQLRWKWLWDTQSLPDHITIKSKSLVLSCLGRCHKWTKPQTWCDHWHRCCGRIRHNLRWCEAKLKFVILPCGLLVSLPSKSFLSTERSLFRFARSQKRQALGAVWRAIELSSSFICFIWTLCSRDLAICWLATC